MTNFLNFKRLEVTGATKEEALQNAPFTIYGDATQKYKKWVEKQHGAITDASKKQFMLDYLAEKSKNVPGLGFSITKESAIANTRERPYTFEDIKNESGARKYKKVYQIFDVDTKDVLAETNETKAKAKEITKQLYKDGYTGNIACRLTHQVVEGEPIVFKAFYTPSKSAKVGVYEVFGIEKD